MVSFKLHRNKNKDTVENWLTANNLLGNTTYEWSSDILTFEHEEDANAFYLTFGIERYETAIEGMLRIEESHSKCSKTVLEQAGL